MSLRREIRQIATDLFAGVGLHRRKRGLPLANRVLVGTHHKAGTLWMFKIFTGICKKFDWEFRRRESGEVPMQFDVFFDGHSNFGSARLQSVYRGLHMIRDPRDVIVSGCFYHQKSQEAWLHEGRPDLGGLTYQEKINSYASLDDRILFEMEHAGQFSIQEMLAWDYNDESFFEIKYEDLMADSDLQLFHRVYAFLGFPGQNIPRMLEISYRNSLFSGKLKNSTHIRSGQTRQWEQHFSATHRGRFVELFGDALQRLGYESNDDWAEAPFKIARPSGPEDSRNHRRAA
jgi:hypothetical protein